MSDIDSSAGERQGTDLVGAYARVRAILDAAIGGANSTIGAHGAFWRNLSRDDFVAYSVYGLPLVQLRDGASSNSVKALRGQPPFGGFPFPRMPARRPPVAGEDVEFISEWIDNGCPDNPVQPRSRSGEAATLAGPNPTEAQVQVTLHPFASLLARAVLPGTLNDGLFRQRFTVVGFSADASGKQAMRKHANDLPDSHCRPNSRDASEIQA